MLELTKKNIHKDCIKAMAGNQITMEDDVNIPDLRPDIDQVIFQSGIIKIEEIKPGNDQVSVRGSLAVHILYQSEEEEEPISKMETELFIDEVFHMEGVNASDSICIKHELEDLSVGIINSRKISVRACVTIELTARGIYDEEAATDVESDFSIEYRKKPLKVLETTVCKKDIFRFRHEETLPAQFPNVLEVLYGAALPTNLECIPEEGKLLIRGNLRLFFLYTPDKEEEVTPYYETTIPIQGEVPCSGLSGQMIPGVNITLAETGFDVKDDYDGENRVFDIEILMDLDIKAYEEKTYDILADMYCVTKDIKTQCKDTVFLQLLQKQQVRARIKERLDLDENDFGNLLHHEEALVLEDIEIEDSKINLTGNLQLRCLYESNKEPGKYCFLERELPFYHTVEGADNKDKVVYPEVRIDIGQMDLNAADEKTLECNATINIHILLLEEKKECIIEHAEVSDIVKQQAKSLPCIVIYMVKEGDSLWQIGKEYLISVDEIKQLNDLSKDEIQPGERLLLMKNRV